MIVKDSIGRQCEIEIEFERSEVDSFASYGVYIDDGSEVPDGQLEYITHVYAAEISEEWFQHMVGLADGLCDD